MEPPPPPPESSNSAIRPDLLIRVKSGSITESISDAFTSLPARFRRQPSGSPSPSSPPHRPSHALLKMVSKITLKDIQGAKQCGEGGFGTVRIFEHPTKGKVALKQLRVSGGQLSDNVRRRTLREGETWQDLKHPHILPFLGILETPTDLYLVSPYVKKGSLDDYLRRNPDLDRPKILWQTAGAITYLHEQGIIHGDIKAANILVSDDVEPLICDFGLAKSDDGVTSVGLQGFGTVRFQSPEVLIEGSGKSFASDVWAFGMTIAEVLSGKLPYHQYSVSTAIISAIVLRDERPSALPSHSSSGLSYDRAWSMAQSCWQKDPALRKSMQYVYRRLCHGMSLGGSARKVNYMTVTLDGKTIVSEDGSPYSAGDLRLWDLVSGSQQAKTLKGHSQQISCLAITPDGKTIVSVVQSMDNSGSEVRLWDLASGSQRGEALNHDQQITCLAIMPDSKTIVSGGESVSGGKIELWDMISGSQRGKTLEGHSKRTNCLAITPDGKTIVSGSGSWTYGTAGELRVWDLASGSQRGETLKGHDREINCLAITPDGKTIVSASGHMNSTSGGELRFWDVASGIQRGETLKGFSGITCLAITPDGKTAVSKSLHGYNGSELRFWDVASGTQRDKVLQMDHHDITCFAITPDGDTLVYWAHPLYGWSELRLYDLAFGS